MVNLSLSSVVAESLVFHQSGDTLEHLLELVWTPSPFTKFATLTLVNLATTENRRRAILRRGGLAALIGLLLGSNFDLQVVSCRALVNLALSPAKHVPLFGSDVFVERLLSKLAPLTDPNVQELVAMLIRNLSVRVQFARVLNKKQHRLFDRLAKLRDSTTSKKSSRGSSGHEDRVQSTGLMLMFATNTLQEFKTHESRAETFVKKLPPFDPVTAEVSWDTWGSKLDRMWDPVFAVCPVAKGIHKEVPAFPHKDVICLEAEDAQLLPLKYRVVTKPEFGSLVKTEGENKNSERFLYCPPPGFSGVDYFTFIASNPFLDSNLGTVSIKVNASLQPSTNKADDTPPPEETSFAVPSVDNPMNVIAQSKTSSKEVENGNIAMKTMQNFKTPKENPSKLRKSDFQNEKADEESTMLDEFQA